MALPTLLVQIAFGLGPYDTVGSGDWVNIADDCLGVELNRGRTSEFDQFPASTCTITLVNDERKYDPLNSAGTFYGDLVANVPVRIRAVYDAVIYDVWRGFVDGWPAEYTDGGFRSTITINCTDAFKLLAQRTMVDHYREFLEGFSAGFPDAWYPCDSIEQGLINLGEIGRTGVAKTTVQTTDPLVPVSSGALLIPPGVIDQLNVVGIQIPVVTETLDGLTISDHWTISMVVQLTGPGYRGIFHSTHAAPYEDYTVILQFTPTSGEMRVTYFIDYGPDYLNGQTTVAVGDVLHLVLVRDGTTSNLYVNGNLVQTETDGAATGAFSIDNAFHNIGNVHAGSSITNPGDPYAGFAVDELMAWRAALTGAEVAELYDYLLAGFRQTVNTGAAMQAVLDEIGWADYTLDGGDALVTLPVNPVGLAVLPLLQNIAQSEAGRLFVDKSGDVRFHARSRSFTETRETTVQYSFTDADRDTTPADVGVRDETLVLTVDDRFVFDAAEVTRDGGVPQVVTTSATPAQTYTASGLLLADDIAARSLAEWIPFRYGTPQARSDVWTIEPEIHSTDWDVILGLEIGDRIELDLTPGGVGSSIALEQHLSVISHDITPERWLVKLNGTPVDPNEDDYFLWFATDAADDFNGWGAVTPPPTGGYWG